MSGHHPWQAVRDSWRPRPESATLLRVKYRIESVSVPVAGGIAHPGSANDQFRQLDGRRIVHVFSDGGAGSPAMSLLVLTEEDD